MNVSKLVYSLIMGMTSMMMVSAAQGSSTSYAIDPHAHALLNQMQASYSALRSLSEQVDAQESADVPHHLEVHTTLKIKRPGYLAAISDSGSSRTGASTVVTDGSFCYVTAPQYPARYLKFAVKPNVEALQTALGENLLSSITLALFANPTTVFSMFGDEFLATLQVANPAKLAGEPVDVVVVSDRNGVSLTLAISRKDHLLRRITVIDPNKPGTFTETYSSVVPNAIISQDVFHFVPPQHMDPYFAQSFNDEEQP